MKARVVALPLFVCAAACVAVAAACSSFSGDPAATEPEAGPDGGADSATGLDAALPPTPGKIDCFGSTCDTTMNPSCCVDVDGGTAQRGASCASGDVPIKCDEHTDCAPGQICCVGFFGNVDCQPTCTGERLCHADSECDVGSSCVKVPCRGKVIGVCGPVGPYVKSFCADEHDQ